jgi:hypothetical protein
VIYFNVTFPIHLVLLIGSYVQVSHHNLEWCIVFPYVLCAQPISSVIDEHYLVRHIIHLLSCFFLSARLLFCVLRNARDRVSHEPGTRCRFIVLYFQSWVRRHQTAVQKFREFILHWNTCTSSLQKLFTRRALTWREEASVYYQGPGSHYVACIFLGPFAKLR